MNVSQDNVKLIHRVPFCVTYTSSAAGSGARAPQALLAAGRLLSFFSHGIVSTFMWHTTGGDARRPKASVAAARFLHLVPHLVCTVILHTAGGGTCGLQAGGTAARLRVHYRCISSVCIAD